MSNLFSHASKRLCVTATRSLHTSPCLWEGSGSSKFNLGLDLAGLEAHPSARRTKRSSGNRGRPQNTQNTPSSSFDARERDNTRPRRDINNPNASSSRPNFRQSTSPRTQDRQDKPRLAQDGPDRPRDGSFNFRQRETSRDGGQFRDNRDRDRPPRPFNANANSNQGPRKTPFARDRPTADRPAGLRNPPVASADSSASLLDGLEDMAKDIDLEEGDDGKPKFNRRGKAATPVNGYEERKKRLEQSREPVKASIKPRKAKMQQVERKIAIPSIISVSNLATLLGTKQKRLQTLMERIGMTDNRPDRVITSDDASLIALEMGYDPVVDNEKAFDIYPDPPAADHSALPLRPSIVAVMGHVDHGKTTLLDTLRSTSVAEGEAGGITQHIGAFEVPLEVLLPAASASTTSAKTITFLDTPGHAAFSAMRSRGRGVTDIVIIVVAADDGVMSQTREVIDLVKDGNGGADPSVGVVVAITKCDKPGADIVRAKESLMAAGLTIDEYGGEIPCVEVSAVTKAGLPELVEMINVLAEVRDLRAERENVKMEGRVVESRVEKGRGNVATVLVLRGNLTPAHTIVAGTSWCKVRQLMPSSGSPLKIAYPGQPVEITGWKALPSAGDEVLQTQTEDEAKKAVAARQERQDKLTLLEDVEVINEKRRIEAEQETARKAEEEEQKKNRSLPLLAAMEQKPDTEPTLKELRLVIKADVSGSVEAVVGCLESIGNKEAHVKIVSSAVGDVSEADLNVAKAADAIIVAFNVNAPRSIQTQANGLGVHIMTSGIIYRLIEEVSERVLALLPPLIDSRVTGEGSILQVFNITIKGRQTKPIAGCRVSNGNFTRSARVRVLRDKAVIFTGSLDTFKQGKNDATTIAKGAECGLSFEGFDEFQAGDAIQMFEEFEVKRQL